MATKTYLEKVIAEAIRPMVGAMGLLSQEIAETMQTPDAPWKILNKPYDKLTEQEIMALFDIYHTERESEPCPMCKWATQVELTRMNKNKQEGL